MWENHLKHKKMILSPILSFIHVSSVIQFDKSILPVVLYEYILICIFMKIHENSLLKNRKTHVKTITWGRGS